MDGESTTFWSGKLYEVARGVVEDWRERGRDVEEDPASSLLAEEGDGGVWRRCIWCEYLLVVCLFIYLRGWDGGEGVGDMTRANRCDTGCI